MSVIREYGGCGLFLLAGLVVLGLLAYFFQSKLVYYPHRYSLATLRRAAEQSALKPWPFGDEHYRGLVTQGPAGERGTVVVFHGNGGSAVDRRYYTAALEPLGFRVVLAEYPGYGPREGELSEASLVADGVTTVRLASQEFPGPLYLWGESLGAAVATGVASAVAAPATAGPSLPVEGLALITPFTSLPDMAVAAYRLPFLRPFVRDRYDSIANLRGFQKPVAILVSERDELIPGEQGQALYDSLQVRKRLWTFPGAGHNTWPAGAGEAWWAEVADFLEPSTSAPASLPDPPTTHVPGQLTEAEDAFGTFYAYVPSTLPETPEILVLVHGTPQKNETDEWNAHYYAARWMEFAEEQGWILIAPTFKQADFSSRLGDHALSGYRGLFGREIGADEWVLRLVRAHQRAYGAEEGSFYLYGHSAGGQFTGRFLMTHPETVRQAVITSAATYPQPDPEVAWPFGLGELHGEIVWDAETSRPVDVVPEPETWLAATQVPLTVIVGLNDTTELPLDLIPGQKGTNRYVIARNWVDDMAAFAEAHGLESRFRLELIPGKGHSMGGLIPYSQEALRGR